MHLEFHQLLSSFIYFSALRIKIKHVTQYRRPRKNVKQTTIAGSVISNIVNQKDKTLNGKSINLQIPCTCKRVFRHFQKEILLATPIPIGSHIIYLGDADWVLPYSRSLRRSIKKKSLSCKNLGTNELEDIREYVDFKINKMRNRRKD